MVFNSASFLFAFLPLSLLVYHLIPGRRGKNLTLIVLSYVFYAFGRPRDLLILTGSALVHYGAGLLLLRDKARRTVTALTVGLDVALLLGCKLTGYLPLGVSFFTFQAISYVVDIYRDRQNGSRSLREVLQYLSFFPQLVSGPLMKFSDARRCMDARSSSAADVAEGLRRFTRGLAKKLLLSAGAATLSDAVFALNPAALDIRTAWLGALCYSLQIFFDFSGYTDMAIGLGRAFGYELPENFRYPYCASSVTDFWRRWHISLSSWFRDYLYIPLGGNRRGRARTICNKLIVFLATGLWHGVSLTFVVWGLWHGLWSALETAFRLPARLEKRPAGHLYALLVAVTGFVIFRAGSLAQAGSILLHLLPICPLTAESGALLRHLLGARALTLLIVSIALCLPLAPALEKRLSGLRGYRAATDALNLLLLGACILALSSGSFQPFIYAQF